VSGSSSITFFYQKKQGNPCCTEILLKGNQPSENCTLGPMRAKKQEKHSKTIYRTKKTSYTTAQDHGRPASYYHSF
jgi:hypothetical protein